MSCVQQPTHERRAHNEGLISFGESAALPCAVILMWLCLMRLCLMRQYLCGNPYAASALCL